MSYLKTVALGLDDFAAAILLNRNDLCISAACGLVREKHDVDLALSSWQRMLLSWIGAALDHFWPGHCEKAVVNDRQRAAATWIMLTI